MVLDNKILSEILVEYKQETRVKVIEKYHFSDEDIKYLIDYVLQNAWTEEAEIIANILYDCGPSRIEKFLPLVIERWLCQLYRGYGTIAILLCHVDKELLAHTIEQLLVKAIKDSDDVFTLSLWKLTVAAQIKPIDFVDKLNYKLFSTFEEEGEDLYCNRAYELLNYYVDVDNDVFNQEKQLVYQEKVQDVREAITRIVQYEMHSYVNKKSSNIQESPWYQKIHEIADHFGITKNDFQNPEVAEYFVKYILTGTVWRNRIG